jgi:hypothetical protein
MLNDAKYIQKPRVAKGTKATGVQVDYSASAPEWYAHMRSGAGMGKAETLTGLRAIVKDGAATQNVHGQKILSYVQEWAKRKPGKGAGEMVAGEFKPGDRVRIGDEWYKAKVNDKTGEVRLIDSQSVEMDMFDKVTVDEFRPAPVAARPGKQAELGGLQRAEAEALTTGKMKKVTGTKAIKEEMLGRPEGEVLPGQMKLKPKPTPKPPAGKGATTPESKYVQGLKEWRSIQRQPGFAPKKKGQPLQTWQHESGATIIHDRGRFGDYLAEVGGRKHREYSLEAAREWVDKQIAEYPELVKEPTVKYQTIPSSEVRKTKGATYRGVGKIGEGTGRYIYGKGLYSATSKDVASQYGSKVVGIKGGIPRKPLKIPSNISFDDWLLRESGLRNMREFNRKYKDPGEFVRSKGYDGVIDGDVVVSYAEYPELGKKGRKAPVKLKGKAKTTPAWVGDKIVDPKGRVWQVKGFLDFNEQLKRPDIVEIVDLKTGSRSAIDRFSLAKEWVEYDPKLHGEYIEPGKGGLGRAKKSLDIAEQKALDRMKKRGTRLTAGIDPAEMADLAIIGAAKIAKGTIKFGEWSAEMVREFGARVKPYLRQIYARSQQGASRLKANAEFDSFVDYFEDIQAPAGLRPPRKPARAAIRERLREEGLTGKELTQATNAEFIVEVNRYGIALRKTKGGKVQPSIREAGTYVPDDFATYGKFRDAKAGSFGGTKDVTRFIQEIDGALPGEVKAKLPGQAGPAERYVTWRTRDMLKKRIAWTRAMRSRLKLISEGVSKEQAKTANQVIAHVGREGAYVDPAKLTTNPKISTLTTDVNVIRFAGEGRKLYESLLRHQNEFRRLIGRKEIPHRDYYTAQSIHETTIWERALGHDKTPKQAIGPGLPDYIKPNAPFNARALARKVGLPETVREMDLRTLLERYIDTAAKDIYNTAIIQNNKAFIQQLESMGYKHAARGLENWTAEAFGGVKGAADRVANLSANVHKGMRIFRFATLRSVFPFNLKWNVLVQPSSTLMGVSRYGYRNSIRGLYDWFGSKGERQGIRDNAYSVIVKSQRSARMSQQDIVRGVGTAERLNRGKLVKAADYANFFTDWVERHLTGWSVATAKRHGASIGLKGKALWEYASDGGAKVQSMYNLEDLPGMLRSEVVKTPAMFQTFKFEAFNTLRELAGKTGMPPATNAIRVKQVLRFVAGATAINYIGQVTLGRKPWELASFIPFYGQLASPIIAAVKGEDVPMTTQRGLPVPLGVAIRGVQATHAGLLKPGVAGIKELIRTGDMNEALEEFMATGKWDKLRRFTIRYLSGYAGIPGGTQINRVVDGLIAVSVGGMKDSAGKMMFPISGTKEEIRTFLGGPWSTESGREYWDKRGKKLDVYIEKLNENPFLRDVVESVPVAGEFVKFGEDSPAIREFDALLARVERKEKIAKAKEDPGEIAKYAQENRKFLWVVGHKPNGDPITLLQFLKDTDQKISKYRKTIREIESDSWVVDKKIKKEPEKLTPKQKRLAISLWKKNIEDLAKSAVNKKED